MRLRPATAEDAATLAAIHTEARAAGMPWLPVLHTPEETGAWFEHVVLPRQHVTVAERDGRVLGFSAVDGDLLEQLYVDPAAQDGGVGSALLDAAVTARPATLRLHVFAHSTRARALYERAGFVCVGTSDGTTTEEGEPDCTYALAPSPATDG